MISVPASSVKPAGLRQAQHVQILLQSPFGHLAVDTPAVLGEGLDGDLGVVVVPGQTVVLKEGSALVPMLAKPLGGFGSQIALMFPVHKLPPELIGILPMPRQMPLF